MTDLRDGGYGTTTGEININDYFSNLQSKIFIGDLLRRQLILKIITRHCL